MSRRFNRPLGRRVQAIDLSERSRRGMQFGFEKLEYSHGQGTQDDSYERGCQPHSRRDLLGKRE